MTRPRVEVGHAGQALAGGHRVDASRREQPLGVWVLRVRDDVVDGPLLNDLTAQHHRDARADLPHDREVVRHEDGSAVGQLLVEEGEDLALHDDVEGSRRLVAVDEPGLVGESHGDEGALALPAGQFVG